MPLLEAKELEAAHSQLKTAENSVWTRILKDYESLESYAKEMKQLATEESIRSLDFKTQLSQLEL